MRRWLVVSLALVLAVGAVYALATAHPGAHPGEIDEESRRKLLQVLKEDSP